MNFRNKNKINDKDILKNISKEIHKPLTIMAKELGLSKYTLYDINIERAVFSEKTISLVLEKYPIINPDYLDYGIEPILIEKETDIKSLNEKIDELKKMVMQLTILVGEKSI